jgi:hypothetical protein
MRESETAGQTKVTEVAATDFQLLLYRVSMITSADDLQANLAEVASQCNEDYAQAERVAVDDSSELPAIVAHAKAAYVEMLNLVSDREDTQGFFNKWLASHRVTRACIKMRSAQALVRMAIDQAEKKSQRGQPAGR